MNKYTLIGLLLSMLVGVAGMLAASDTVGPVVPAVAGVVCGMWWAFGRSFLPDDRRDHLRDDHRDDHRDGRRDDRANGRPDPSRDAITPD